MLGRLACLVVALCLVGQAIGQEQPAAAVPVAAESHGWMGVRALEGGGAVLLHLPPRTRGAMVGAEAGTARLAKTLSRAPAAVAPWDRSVYLFYAGTERVEVYSARVARVGISGAWVTEPAEGAKAEQFLETGGASFVDAAASGRGPIVLGRGDAWRVWLLGGGGWRAVDLPMDLAESSWAWLVQGAAEPTVLAIGDGGVERWTLTEGEAEQWERESLGEGDIAEPGLVVGVFDSAGDVCVAELSGSEVSVRSLGPSLAGAVASVRLDGTFAALSRLEDGRRLGVLSVVRDDTATGRREPIESWEYAELSMVSGRELYRGSPVYPALAIGDEIRLLSLFMMVMTVCVLFYLLRPLGGDEVSLPEGFALATPGRRMVARIIDALLMMGLLHLTVGVPMGDLVLVLPLLESPTGMVALAALLIGGAAYSTLSESASGRTIGKALVGIRVVSVDPARRRVGLMRTGARNVFCWLLAPWAVFGLGSADFRHRGDVFAGAAVVVRRQGANGTPDDPDGDDEAAQGSEGDEG